MGKKRIITESGQGEIKTGNAAALAVGKRKLTSGILHIQATYNNTKITLTNTDGGAIVWSSSGALGFKGAKKGTPFAAGKVAEVVAERGQALGLKEAVVVLKGVGSGREAAIRAFAATGLVINSIKDTTPVPFNGPKPAKPRRV